MTRWVKILGWLVAGLVALFAVGALVLYFLVPRDKIIARVIPPLEAALGRKVHLGDAGISLWPPFGVFLADLRVENKEPGPMPDLLNVVHLRGQLAWRQLLSAELRFSSLAVTGLALHYERFDDTTSNISDLLGGSGGVWPVLVEHLEFENLQASVSDRRDSSAWFLEGVHLELIFDPVALDFECTMLIPGVRMRHGAQDTTYPGPVEAGFHGSVTKNPPALTIRDMRGMLRDVPWSGQAVLQTAPAGSTVDGHLTLGPVTVGQVLAHLPGQRQEALSAYDISGDLQWSVTARGALDSLASGAAQAEMSWTRGRIADSLGEWLSFSAISIPVDHEGFHVDADQLMSRYGPVKVAAVGSWPPEGRLELSVSGRSDIGSLVHRETGTATGAIEWSASASGPLEDPASWRLGARAQFQDVRFEEDRREPFEVGAAELSYDGAHLRLERLSASYGRSDLELTGAIEGLSWVEYMKDRPLSPSAVFEMRSHRLDLDALFPQLAGDSAAPADTSARPPLPPGSATFVADIDTLILGGALWRRMHGSFSLIDGRCVIDTLYGSVYGGRVHLAGEIDSIMLPQAPYEFRVKADSLEIGDLLGRFGSVGRHLRGRSHLAAKIDGRGAGTHEVLQELAMEGSVNLFDTSLENLDVALKLQQLLGSSVQDPLPIRSVSNRFRFEGGRTQVDDFKFNTPQGAWVLGGSAGLDGSLDYTLSGLLPPSVASSLKLPESWFSALPAEWQGKVDPLDLLKNDEGAIDLYFTIGGTLRSPNVAVDWAKLQPLFKQRFESRLKQKVTDEVQKELQEGLKGLFDKLKR